MVVAGYKGRVSCRILLPCLICFGAYRWLVDGCCRPDGMLARLRMLHTGIYKACVLQVWDSVSSLPIPRLNNATPDNSPIFFIHGVGFGLVRLCSLTVIRF